MILDTINGSKLKDMFYNAAQLLEKNKQKVNALNVFPVPDGDTGTNMSLTMTAAIKEIRALSNGDVDQVADAMAKGSLKGARGNSGVILSQLFRGFAKELKGTKSLTTQKFAAALKAGADTSYKAVIKPVEGTMLTVARVTADEAEKIALKYSDFNLFFQEIIDAARKVLNKTPDMLPILKQAGVVDAGGMGLIFILLGSAYVLRDDLDVDFDLSFTEAEILEKPELDFAQEGLEEIGEGYCTEFLIKNLHVHIKDEDYLKFQDKLTKLGDSLVFVKDDDVVKIHIHTNAPGKILQFGLKFGELSGIKIDNMREQHKHLSEIDSENKIKSPSKNIGIVAVAAGEGIVAIFKDLGADKIVEGGQTMNPSIQDILEAVEDVDAEDVFILPNNSNIILSANQVKQLSSRNIHVIPSKSIPQGISAMVSLNTQENVKQNIDKMSSALSSIKTGLVTYAVRNSSFNGISINNGDIIGISEGSIEVAGTNVSEVTKNLIEKLVTDDCTILTLYVGQDVNENDAFNVSEYVENKYPFLEVEVYPGGQPIYYYIISLE